ncbi:MAG: hypothetical protein FJX25_09860 [Alphaproteobacteria bacterium]|nr:hypothetical protein [Alphaproteobacteria bacterium]
MTDRAEEIMQCLIEVASTLGLPVEVDRRYPLSIDGQTEGTPSDLPLVIVRSGSQSAENPDYKQWTTKWRMKPYIVVALQDHDDPDALRVEANRIWLDFLRALKASRLPRLLADREVPNLACDIKPQPGRPDVTMMVMSVEVVFNRDL